MPEFISSSVTRRVRVWRSATLALAVLAALAMLAPYIATAHANALIDGDS